MGDVVYPGVELNRVDPQITVEKVLQYLSRQFNHVPNLYRNDTPEIAIIDKKNKPAIVIIRGIMLTLDEIKEKVGRSLLSGRQVFVTNVDFYIPRNINGDFDHMNLVLHNNLKEGQGILPPLNLFTDQFNNEFGTIDHQSNVAFYRGKKGSIPLWELKKCGNVLSFGGTTQRGVWKQKNESYDITEVIFIHRSEALQAVCYLNSKTFDAVPRVFITSDDGLECKILQNYGLGSGGNLLNISATVRRHGFLPFTEFHPGLLSAIKLKQVTTVCHFCDQKHELLGWGPEFSWIAATCKCDMQKMGFSWKGENFIRLLTSRHGRKMLAAPEGYKDAESIELFPFIRGIVPLFDDVDHFRSAAWVAYRMECAYSARRLRSQQALGVVREAAWVEDGEVRDTKVSYFHVRLSVETRGPSSAWADGNSAITRITIIRQPDGGTGPNTRTPDFVTESKEKSKRNIRSVVHDISCSQQIPHTYNTVVVAVLLRGEELRIGERCILIPKGPVGEKNAVRAALSSWNKEMDIRRNPPTEVPCTIIAAQLESTPFIQKTMNGFVIFLVDVLVERHKVWNILAAQLDHVYAGCKINVTTMDHEMETKTASICSRVIRVDNTTEGMFTKLQILLILTDSTKRVMRETTTLSLWLISKTAKLQHNMDCDDNVVTEDEVWESEDESDSDETSTPANDIIPKVIDDSPQLNFNHKIDPNFRPVTTKNMDVIVKSWINDPFEPCTIMDFFLHPSDIVRHNLDLQSAIAKSNFDESKLKGMLKSLDDSQFKAVDTMLQSRLSVCQGPAGTGKTTMVSYGVASIYMKERGLIVVCAPTNFATSVVYEKIGQVNKLHDLNITVIRMFSHSNEKKHLRESKKLTEQDQNYLHIRARLDPNWMAYSDVNLAREREIEVGTSKLTNKEKELIRSHRLKIHVDAISEADVIVCTVGCASDGRITSALRTLQRRGIPLAALVVDESSVLTIPTTLPLLRLNPVRVFLAGDHCQLCPLLGDATAKLANLDVSWFEILRQTRIGVNENVVSLLTTQYRMAVPIANVVSGYIYGNLVKSAESVKLRSYKRYDNMLGMFPEMREVHISIQTYDPLSELQDKNSTSFYNQEEILITKKILLKLLASNVLGSVCILSMYDSHVTHLKTMKEGLGEEFQECVVASTDSYQGRECDILIINMVRSNATKQIGFLRDQRRVNVAISRARDYVFLVGHLSTIQCGKVPSVKILLDMLVRENVKVVKWETGEEGRNGAPFYLRM